VSDWIDRHGLIANADLDALLLAKLPDVLSPEQKANMVKNLLQAMRLGGLVHRQGPRGQGLATGSRPGGACLDRLPALGLSRQSGVKLLI